MSNVALIVGQNAGMYFRVPVMFDPELKTGCCSSRYQGKRQQRNTRIPENPSPGILAFTFSSCGRSGMLSCFLMLALVAGVTRL
jgi:hypothetical protein